MEMSRKYEGIVTLILQMASKLDGYFSVKICRARKVLVYQVGMTRPGFIDLAMA